MAIHEVRVHPSSERLPRQAQLTWKMAELAAAAPPPTSEVAEMVACRVIDLSQSGAAVATDQRPDIGALITIGKTTGRVVRHLEDGFAVEFTREPDDFLGLLAMGLSMGQWLSLPMVVAGIAMLAWAWRTPAGTRA